MCITTKDILDACPFAALPLPAAAASQHAPATAHEGHDGSTSGVSTAALDAGSEEAPPDSEEAPLSNRPRPDTAPSKPTASASSGKRKRGAAESGEARAEVELPAVSHEASSLAKAFVKGYELDEDADRITALDFIQDLAPHVKDKDLRATLLDCKRAGSRVRALLKEAFDAINEGKSDIVKRS